MKYLTIYIAALSLTVGSMSSAMECCCCCKDKTKASIKKTEKDSLIRYSPPTFRTKNGDGKQQPPIAKTIGSNSGPTIPKQNNSSILSNSIVQAVVTTAIVSHVVTGRGKKSSDDEGTTGTSGHKDKSSTTSSNSSSS